jgi:hypothetical protein
LIPQFFRNRLSELALAMTSMTNVISFDVQVYDLPVFVLAAWRSATRSVRWVAGGTLCVRHTPSWVRSNLYRCLRKSDATLQPYQSILSGYLISATTPPSTIWSWHYENDGILQMGVPPILRPTDDNANGIVDDITERDTMPPYSAPLRGIRITIRVYEPSSLQVRQVTIVQDFLPE